MVFCATNRDVIFIEPNKKMVEVLKQEKSFFQCVIKFTRIQSKYRLCGLNCSLKFGSIKFPTPTASLFAAK